MPSVSEKQRRFMGAELERLREGKKTQTGMDETQLEDFARKPVMPKLPSYQKASGFIRSRRARRSS